MAGAALVGSLAGPPLAGAAAKVASAINGSDIKNHSIAGKKLINNTLGGNQINESKLAAVPAAKTLKPLAPGHSESGVYSAGSGDSTSGWIGLDITFPQRLAHKIVNGNVIWLGNGANAHCPGPGHAAPGFLCLYDAEHFNVTFYGDRDDLLPASPGAGAIVWFNPTAADSYVAGMWTVTAP
jgi:hypothetical protein